MTAIVVALGAVMVLVGHPVLGLVAMVAGWAIHTYEKEC